MIELRWFHAEGAEPAVVNLLGYGLLKLQYRIYAPAINHLGAVDETEYGSWTPWIDVPIGGDE